MDRDREQESDQPANERDLSALVNNAMINSKRIAICEAIKTNPDLSYIATEPIPGEFGSRWEHAFSRRRDLLIEKYNSAFNDLLTIAARYFVYSCRKASSFMLGIRREIDIHNVENQDDLITPEGYADSEGWAYTVYNGLAELNQPMDLLDGLTFSEHPPQEDILSANGLIWFFDAAALKQRDEFRAMDVLFEAADAELLSDGIRNWNESIVFAKEEGYLPVTAPDRQWFSINGLKGSKARHAANNELRKWAVEKYKEGDWRSANHAAYELKKSIINHGRSINAHLSEENAQRTIAEWFRKSL